ncbi:Virulence protein [BD1-7 clade bacterium]|uniref:Virulence protein n=1 Tax=BD1-7 clade bacterium TaxID=2029982 RepID=A0A5S9QVI3_9GAMM|nr:Virulence protein [BD1-7 clade bacterium]
MIDHISVGVSDIEKAANFYDRVLTTIGYQQHAKFDNIVAYGIEKINFLAMLPFDAQPHSAGNGVHIAFSAEDKNQVDAFHHAAIENGGACEGAPGHRDYPHGEVYTAYIRDPFGNKFEVISGGFHTH